MVHGEIYTGGAGWHNVWDSDDQRNYSDEFSVKSNGLKSETFSSEDHVIVYDNTADDTNTYQMRWEDD